MKTPEVEYIVRDYIKALARIVDAPSVSDFKQWQWLALNRPDLAKKHPRFGLWNMKTVGPILKAGARKHRGARPATILQHEINRLKPLKLNSWDGGRLPLKQLIISVAAFVSHRDGQILLPSNSDYHVAWGPERYPHLWKIREIALLVLLEAERHIRKAQQISYSPNLPRDRRGLILIRAHRGVVMADNSRALPSLLRRELR